MSNVPAHPSAVPGPGGAYAPGAMPPPPGSGAHAPPLPQQPGGAPPSGAAQQQQQAPPVASLGQTAEFFLSNYRLGKTLGIGSFGKVRGLERRSAAQRSAHAELGQMRSRQEGGGGGSSDELLLTH